MNRRLALCAAVLGFTAVLLGAVGTHVVGKRVEAHDLETWKTAAFYHGLHAVVLLALASWKEGGRFVAAAGACFTAGAVVFAGSLYMLVLSKAQVGLPESQWLHKVTPVGGLLLMAGWLLLAVAALRWKKLPSACAVLLAAMGAGEGLAQEVATKPAEKPAAQVAKDAAQNAAKEPAKDAGKRPSILRAPAGFTPDTVVVLPGGGFSGKLVALSEGKLVVDTWFAGRLTLDTRQVVGLRPLDKAESAVREPWFELPRGVIADAKWSVRGLPEPIDDGRLSLAKWEPAESRMALFPDKESVEFVVEGPVLDLKFVAVSPDGKNRQHLNVMLRGGQIQGNWMETVDLPGGGRRGLGASLPIRPIQWKEPSKKVRLGFYPQGEGDNRSMQIRLDGRTVATVPIEHCPPWKGKLTLLAEHGATLSDGCGIPWHKYPSGAGPRLVFVNKDSVAGAPDSIRGGKVRFKMDGGDAMEVPFARFAWIGFPPVAPGAAVPAPAHLLLADADLPVQLAAPEADAVAGTLAGAGQVRVPAGAVWKVVAPETAK